jgi:heme oxygenase
MLDLRSRADYRRFLEASASALLPLEGALEEAGVDRLFPDWRLRSRRSAIQEDLSQLGGVPFPLAKPIHLDDEGIVGTMYVLEGSRVGAKPLLKTVLTSSDPEVVGATLYLRHGEGQHLWQSMLVTLDQFADDLADASTAIDGARRAFELFARAAAVSCEAHR